jgi:hypothetical protein
MDRKDSAVERDGTAPGQDGGHEIPPLLQDALAGLDPGTLQELTEVIVLHRQLPAWAVWLPHRGGEWVAVRPASARAPGPDLPLLWAHADNATGLADRMRRADGQLSPP